MKDNILLLHGALGAKIQLEPLGSALKDRFEVLLLNFEGHGGRPSDKPFTMEGFAANIIAYLNNNGIERCHIFGYSMGGYAALTAALTHPDRIESILTLGTKFDWTPASSARETKMLDPEVITVKVPHFAQRLEALNSPEDWKTQMVKTREMMLALGNGTALSSEQLTAIQQPVHILLGSEDHMVSSEESQWASKALPHGTFQILEGVKHPIEKVDLTMIASRIRQLLGAS